MSGCSVLSSAPSLDFVNPIQPIEYGDTSINVLDFVERGKYDSIQVSEFDPFQLGEQNITYTIKNHHQILEKTLTVIVVDTQFPYYTEKAEEAMILQGDFFDVSNYFKAVDPVDGEVSVSLKTDLDTNIAGIYKLDVEAIDKNGNINKYTFTLAIKSLEEIASIEENVIPQAPEYELPSSDKPVEPPSSEPYEVLENEQEKPNQSKPQNKEFLFEDGYNMTNVDSACYAYINQYQSFARACIPLKNSEGVYYGMLAKFD